MAGYNYAQNIIGLKNSGGGGGGDSKHHYSTEEHIVGTWVDGTPLYEKTVDLELENTSNIQTFTGVSLGLGTIKVVVDACFINSNGQQLRLARWAGSDYWTYIITSNFLIKRDTSDANWMSGVHFMATVQYTKTQIGG